MKTPSLQRAALRGAILAFLVVSVSVASFVFFNMRAQLNQDLTNVLAGRRITVERIITEENGDLSVVASRLADSGIPSNIVLDNGRDLSRLRVKENSLTTEILVTGAQLTVGVSRDGATRVLQRLVIVLSAGFLVTISLALLLLRRAVGFALRPLGAISETAQRIASGDREQRLTPDDPTTELGGLAQSFDEMLDALAVALRIAQTAEQAQRKFLADVAHQMRTPLAGIRVSSELLLFQAADADPQEGERLLGNLVRETNRVARLVNGLLRIARLDLDTGLLLQSTDLGQLCRTEVERQQDLTEARVRFVIDDPPSAPVLIDPNQFREVLANLLDNARHFAANEIVVRLNELPDGSCVIVVTDDGPGVQPEDHERIFERFVSIGQAQGTGLGLSIARSIARAHGGDLVSTDEGFVLTLPSGALPVTGSAFVLDS
ncbi:MAG: HAMP domain-containing sensor histidine kinase [Nitriliruptoraceae bacterium]